MLTLLQTRPGELTYRELAEATGNRIEYARVAVQRFVEQGAVAKSAVKIRPKRTTVDAPAIYGEEPKPQPARFTSKPIFGGGTRRTAYTKLM